MKNRVTFNDDKLQSEFQKEGYVIFNALTTEDLDNLRIVYNNMPPPDLSSKFHTSRSIQDTEYQKRIDRELELILKPALIPFFKKHKSLYSYFMVKLSGEESKVTVHQDWTIVDEETYTGITVWCPLEDITSENGAFHVVRRSHKFDNNVRGSNILSDFAGIYDQIEKNFMTEVLLKAGEVLAFDHRLLHYSPPNLSGRIRVVAGHVLLPEEASMIHYYREDPEDNGPIELYECDDKFLINYAFGDKPDGLNKIGVHKLKDLSFDERAFMHLYKKFNPDSWLKKMKRFVNKSI